MADNDEPTPPQDDPPPAPIEIIVDDDGQVFFTDLPPELQAIVDELNPDAPRSTVCLIPAPDAAADTDEEGGEADAHGAAPCPETSTDAKR